MKKFSTLIMVMFAMMASQSIQAKNTQTVQSSEIAVNDNVERDDMRYKKEPDPEFKFEKDSVTIDLAEEGPYELPKLLNPNNLILDGFGVSDSNLASVDDKGNFSITDLYVGDVILYAKSKRNAKFDVSEAQCVVHIINTNIVVQNKFGNDAEWQKREGDCGWYEESSTPVWELTQAQWWAYGAYKLYAPTTAYLVSPKFELKDANAYQVIFTHTFAGFKNNDDAQFVIREAGSSTWTVIEGIEYPEGDVYQPVSSGKLNVPAEFIGKNVEFAFKYFGQGQSSDGNWNIDTFTLLKAKGSGEDTGIESISVKKEFKDNNIYDLQGRIVKNPARGIYIVNGKKVILR